MSNASSDRKYQEANDIVYTSMVGVILQQNDDEIINQGLCNLTIAKERFSEERMRECAERAFDYLLTHPAQMPQVDAVKRLQEQGVDGLYQGIMKAVKFRESMGLTAEKVKASADWKKLAPENGYGSTRASIDKVAQVFVEANTFNNYLRYAESEGRKQAGDFFLAARMQHTHKALQNTAPIVRRETYPENATLELMVSHFVEQYDRQIDTPHSMLKGRGTPVQGDMADRLKDRLPRMYQADMKKEVDVLVTSSKPTLLVEDEQGKQHMFIYGGDYAKQDVILENTFDSKGNFLSEQWCKVQDVMALLEQPDSKVSTLFANSNMSNTALSHVTVMPIDKNDVSYSGTMHMVENYLACRDQLRSLNQTLGKGSTITYEQEHCLEVEAQYIGRAVEPLRKGARLEDLGKGTAQSPYSHDKLLQDNNLTRDDVLEH